MKFFSLKSDFLKNALAYSGTNAFSQVLLLVQGFVVRRLIVPELMGIWNLMNVVYQFLLTFDLGCVAGAGRELPILHGRGEREKEALCRSTTFWFVVAQTAVVALGAVGYAFWKSGEYTQLKLIGTLGGIGMYVFFSFFAMYTMFYQSSMLYVPLSKLAVIMAVFDLINFPLCAYVWGLPGLIAITLLSAALKAVTIYFVGGEVGVRAGRGWDKGMLRKMLGFGLSIRAADYPGSIAGLADILWVTKFMSLEALAIYAMARSFVQQIGEALVRIDAVFSTRLLQQYGRGEQWSVIGRDMARYIYFQLVVVVPLLCWAGAALLPLVIRQVIPEYAGANDPLRVLLISNFFLVTNAGLTTPWIIKEKMVARGVSNVVRLAGAVAALAVFWFVLERRTILDMAYAVVAGFAVYFLYMAIAVGREVWSGKEISKIVAAVLLASLWTAYVIIFEGRPEVAGVGLIGDIKSTLVEGLKDIVLILPITVYGLRKSYVLGKRPSK